MRCGASAVGLHRKERPAGVRSVAFSLIDEHAYQTAAILVERRPNVPLVASRSLQETHTAIGLH